MQTTIQVAPKPLTATAREDARVARWLFAVTLAILPLSSPMFLSHFRAATSATSSTPSVPAFFVIELVKVALFSGLAVWAGARAATEAGIDAPVVRALLRGDAAAAARAVKDALPISLVLGTLALATGAAIRAHVELTTIAQALTQPDDHGSPLVRLTGLFYGVGIELWFRWGVLSLATRAASRRLGLAPERAFLVGNALAALSFGVFAIPSVWGPHAGAPGASRYLAEALVGYGLPSFFNGAGVRRFGFVSAVLAMVTAQVLGAVLRGVLGG
jgi:hypothetical protein